jgi:GDP-4-dehydro-6-deoxy-D-mannose reductase
MKLALITGLNGFVGPHLAKELMDNGYTVIGTVRPHSTGTPNLDRIPRGVSIHEGDLQDSNFVNSVIGKTKPDVIFHLAAQSFVATSFTAPDYTLVDNIRPQLNILEAIKGSTTILHVACSSEQYGLVKPEECPIKETQPFRPLSPYAVSKITQEYLALHYWWSYRTPVVITRAFNHEGPGRGRDFVTSTFAEQIAKIEAGKQEPIIKHGNLESVRDFTDVRDVVRAYRMLVENKVYGRPINVCSGKGTTITELLNRLIVESTGVFDVLPDESRMRPSDLTLLVGDGTLIRELIGWAPEIELQQTLRDLLNYWRAYHGVQKGTK